MDWKKYIDADPSVLGGKPVVKGTRLSVDFILGLFAAGWSREAVLQNYPGLSPESLNAVFAFASDALHDESLYFMRKDAA